MRPKKRILKATKHHRPEVPAGLQTPSGGLAVRRALSAEHRRFVAEGIADVNENWARAYRVVWPHELNPAAKARQLLSREIIQTAIASAKKRALQHAEIEKGWILQRLRDFVRADVNDIVEGRRVPCRKCHGRQHRYQWRNDEMEDLLAAYQCGVNNEDFYPLDPSWTPEFTESIRQYYALGRAGRSFDELGGDGYSKVARIFSLKNGMDHNCPACHGDGTFDVLFHDTRYLSPQAALLYDGIEQTPQGIRIKIRSRQFAEEALIKASPDIVEKKQVEFRVFAPEVLTDEEMIAAILRAQQEASVELEATEFEDVTDREGSDELASSVD